MILSVRSLLSDSKCSSRIATGERVKMFSVSFQWSIWITWSMSTAVLKHRASEETRGNVCVIYASSLGPATEQKKDEAHVQTQ